jgi:MoxR-like ATPase
VVVAQAAEKWTDADLKNVAHLKEAHDKILQQIRKAVVGQQQVVNELMIVLFAQGHALLMGVPGLAKTLLVRTLASSLSLQFSRVQFTPDLMPSDITGTEVIQEDRASGQRQFKFVKGPIFTNILLADEINRTPPKTQAALLEAMQEIQVTVAGERPDLPRPFLVLATQNPIEQEGTYPLPEAQLDRFMFQINVDYPSESEELQVLDMTTTNYRPAIETALGGDEILRLQSLVRKVLVTKELKEFVVRIVRATRPGRDGAAKFVNKWVSWGAGPRASQNLILGAKAWAILNGRHEANPDDVRFVAGPVLGHRIVTNFSAEAEGTNSSKIVEMIMEEIQ